jgi:hypothetical protein
MAMQYDVKSNHLSAAGTLFAGPTRLKGLIICPAVSTAATIQFKDGGSSGPILLEIDIASNSNPNTYTFDVPGEGIRFSSSLYLALSAAVTGVTAFYG